MSLFTKYSSLCLAFTWWFILSKVCLVKLFWKQDLTTQKCTLTATLIITTLISLPCTTENWPTEHKTSSETCDTWKLDSTGKWNQGWMKRRCWISAGCRHSGKFPPVLRMAFLLSWAEADIERMSLAFRCPSCFPCDRSA